MAKEISSIDTTILFITKQGHAVAQGATDGEKIFVHRSLFKRFNEKPGPRATVSLRYIPAKGGSFKLEAVDVVKFAPGDPAEEVHKLPAVAKFFETKKGFGFVTIVGVDCPFPTRDAFVHIKACQKAKVILEKGDKLVAGIKLVKGKPRVLYFDCGPQQTKRVEAAIAKQEAAAAEAKKTEEVTEETATPEATAETAPQPKAKKPTPAPTAAKADSAPTGEIADAIEASDAEGPIAAAMKAAAGGQG